jgi:hypothetical protein
MDNWLGQLEQYLVDLLNEHEAMLAVIRDKRQALTQARPHVVAELCARQNQHLQKIGAIEKRRQTLVGQLTEVLNPAAAEPLRLRDIAEQAPQAQRERLIDLHARLRNTMRQIAHEAAVTQKATSGLLNHIQGMMGMISQSFASLGTYGRKGIDQGPTSVVSSFSVTG